MSLTILQIGQNYRMYGGSDKYQLDLSGLLERSGHTVIPFAARSADNKKTPWSRYFPEGADFESPGVRDVVNYVYSANARRSITRLITEQHVDLAHLHIYYGKLTASILKPLNERNIPVVQTVHDYKILCPIYTLYRNGKPCELCNGSRFYNVLLNRCNRGSVSRSFLSMIESYASKFLGVVDRVDHFIAVSRFVREKLIASGIPGDKVTAVHNYVDTAQFRVGGEKGKYIFYLGRLEKYKGVFTLLEAAQLVPTIEIRIAGHGGEQERVKRIIHEKKINNVKLLGYLDGHVLQEALDRAICTVLPSECHETFGLAITESFASGKPVIASAVGGIPEIITDGEDGGLFEARDHIRLAELMRWYWEHREEAQRMGEKGRLKVERSFNPKAHLEQVLKIYDSVLCK